MQSTVVGFRPCPFQSSPQSEQTVDTATGSGLVAFFCVAMIGDESL
jgi:hypothetical protein